MLILHDIESISLITNPAIKKLVALRWQQLQSPGDLDSECFELIVVEAGDEVSAIEDVTGLPILTGLFDDLPYNDADFQPCSEILEAHRNEHSCIYEMVFIGNDDGAATAIFIPDTEGVDDDLLAMCRSFATPAVSTP
jgi:hypothetical protein